MCFLVFWLGLGPKEILDASSENAHEVAVVVILSGECCPACDIREWALNIMKGEDGIWLRSLCVFAVVA